MTVCLTTYRTVIYYVYFFLFKAEHPVYWTVREWCEGFKKLIDYLNLEKVHLFGASLGKSIFKYDFTKSNVRSKTLRLLKGA